MYERVLILDGANYAHRLISGRRLPENPPLKRLALEATVSIRRLVGHHQPDFMMTAWDRPSLWRTSLYRDYKANRNSTHFDGRSGMARIMDLMPIFQWEVEGAEADDLIYAAVCYFHALGSEEIIIESADHDFYQLLDRVDLTKSDERTTAESFREMHRFDCSKWVQFRGLMGDPSDNIKGVGGIGRAKAQRILEEFGDLEDFLDREDLDIPLSRMRDLIVSDYREYIRSRQLVDLSCFPGAGDLLRDFGERLEAYTPKLDWKGLERLLGRNMMHKKFWSGLYRIVTHKVPF